MKSNKNHSKTNVLGKGPIALMLVAVLLFSAILAAVSVLFFGGESKSKTADAAVPQRF